MDYLDKIKVWPRKSWPYYLYSRAVFMSQPYRDSTFEATQIIENLWVGDIRSPCDKKSLKDRNIHMIVSAVHGASAYHPFDFHYINADLRDLEDENILTEIRRILPMIHNCIVNGKGVLVHCMKGASRSATITAAYLIKYKNMTTDGALKYMTDKRSCVNPNEGYVQQLRNFELNLKLERDTKKGK